MPGSPGGVILLLGKTMQVMPKCKMHVCVEAWANKKSWSRPVAAEVLKRDEIPGKQVPGTQIHMFE